jgi:hypothetical protein
MSQPVTLVPPPTDEQPQFEGELRDVLRRADNTELRREYNGVDASSTPSRENLTKLVSRVAGTSTGQVERVVLQLQSIKDLLHSEGERVNREIAGYIKLNDHATSAMQAISAALKQLSDAIPKRQA